MTSDLPYKQILYLGLTASCLMGNTFPYRISLLRPEKVWVVIGCSKILCFKCKTNPLICGFVSLYLTD